MKVSMWHNNRDIRLEEVPTPSPETGELLVKVLACGICGSDIVEWYRLPRAPLVQGHEVGVEVVECGEGVAGFSPGDRLFIAPKVPCMECECCRQGHHPQCTSIKDRLPGGFAEYMVVPREIVARGAYRLPDHVTDDQATFIEPLACAVRAQRLAALDADETILILGAGMSGLLHLKLAKLRGCRVIVTDINPWRLDLARRMGADRVIDATSDVPGQVVEANGGKADVVMVTTSALPALEQAWASVKTGGAVVLFTVPGPDQDVVVPLNDFWRKEVRILTSYYCGPQDLEESLEIIASRAVEVDDLITHRLPLKDTAEGFRMLLDGSDSLKIIIKPQQV
jgi:L-iditol 2-dehydrogenase